LSPDGESLERGESWSNPRAMKRPAVPPDLIEQAAAHFREHGYAIVRGVFAPHEVAHLAAAFDRHWLEGMAHPATFRHGNLLYRLGEDAALGRVLRLVQWPSYVDPVLARFRTDERLFRVVEPMLGPDVKQIINQMHWKPPGAAAAEFAFHQDARFRRPREAYRNLFDSYVQTGIAIDPHTRANGAMRVYPGSHLLGELDLAIEGAVMDAAMGEAGLRQAGLDPARLVDVELEPGDVAFWHVCTIHGSGRNTTAGDRRFYLNGYVRAEDCDRGEWAFRGGQPCVLGEPVLVHYEDLHLRPGPHYIDP
jgi:ectoine hydroxylase-related dioxygenase (phytanoyl-CoA dioxygenase family)